MTSRPWSINVAWTENNCRRPRALTWLAAFFFFAAPWIAQAEDDKESRLEEPALTDFDRQHWAYRPLTAPTLPEVRDEAWPCSAIDRFVLAAIEQAGLHPAPEADRITLLRRATFDLTGLPPTPAEVDAFLSDPAPDAWQRVVDRLLASPAYGERWAQHWLDLARFAETDGFEHDLVRPEAWRYRDWVIDALNQDLPYDEFARRQIAGDELYPGDGAAAVATGFLLAGPDMPDLNLPDERRHMVLNELTGAVGAVFLGMQIGCAQCHDHKYDPVSQADFYRLRAVFETAELFKPHTYGRVMQPLAEPAPPSHLMVRGDFRRPGPEIAPGFPRICNPWQDEPPAAAVGTAGRRAALAAWLTRPDHPLVTRVLVNRMWQHHFGEGLVRSASDFGLMGEPPTNPELLDWLARELPAGGWSLKHLHRLLLCSATWRQASRLDEVASGDPALTDAWRKSLSVDPDNRLWTRMSRRRLEGEAVRDSLLACADRLSQRRGGPGVMGPLPPELLGTLLKGQWQVAADPVDHRRRSIYLFARRNLRDPLFEAFDRPDLNASCPRRDRSTTAPQALTLLNAELSLNSARDLAATALQESPGDAAGQVAACYRRALGRYPAAIELQAALDFLSRQAEQIRRERGEPAAQAGAALAEVDPTEAAFVDFCLALINLNEFVYID